MIKETSLSNLQVLVGKVLPAWNPCFSTFSSLLSSVWTGLPKESLWEPFQRETAVPGTMQ